MGFLAMWEQLIVWSEQIRTVAPSVHPQLALVILYLVLMWFYFRAERSKLALLPFLGGLMFLLPVLMN